jgi:hypothetical protein
MEHRDWGVRSLRASWPSFRASQWLLVTISMLGVTFCSAAPAIAQTCEDRNPAHAAVLVDQIRYSCERDDTPYSADGRLAMA